MTLQNAQLQLDDTPDLASETVIKAAHDIAGHLGAGSQVTRKDINAIFQKLTGNGDAILLKPTNASKFWSKLFPHNITGMMTRFPSSNFRHPLGLHG